MNPLMVTAVIYGGKKLIENAAPNVLKKGASLSFNFLKDNLEDRVLNKGKVVSLNRGMDILDNDLSVPRNYCENQMIKISQDINDDLSIIKGQNEILFLSNSVEYFLKGHEGRTGIDRGISYALQYDISAVLNHIKRNQNLRFPGYMLHQCAALSATIRDYNIFYDSILNDGHVTDWSQVSVDEELEKTFGPHGVNNPMTPYMPYEYQMNWLRRGRLQKNPSKWPLRLPFFGNDTESLDEAHDSLVTLSRELIASEALERRLTEKLVHLPENKLIILSGR